MNFIFFSLSKGLEHIFLVISFSNSSGVWKHGSKLKRSIIFKGICSPCSWLHACVLSHSVVSNSLRPHGVACPAPLSVKLSRREYWSGLPLSPPGDLPKPRINPRIFHPLQWQADPLPLHHLGSPLLMAGIQFI